jgi:hypothetical protein
MIYYPVEDVNTADCLLTEIDVEGVNTLIGMLTGDNMNVMLSSKGIDKKTLDCHYKQY